MQNLSFHFCFFPWGTRAEILNHQQQKMSMRKTSSSKPRSYSKSNPHFDQKQEKHANLSLCQLLLDKTEVWVSLEGSLQSCINWNMLKQKTYNFDKHISFSLSVIMTPPLGGL